MHTFNLSKLQKKAYYDDGKALVTPMTRGMMNCYKLKMEKGATAHEARESCVDEFQKCNSSDWAVKYSAHK